MLSNAAMPRVAELLLCALACALVAACGGKTNPVPKNAGGAIECRFATNTLPPDERTVLLRPGERKRVVIEPLYLEAQYGWELQLIVKAGQVELLSQRYQPREQALPDNQFENDQGFTGLIALSHPSRGGKYSLVCRSIRSAAEEKKQRRPEDEETESKLEAKLKNALRERAPCEHNKQYLTRDGPRCPPINSLSVRRDSLLALHKLGARRFGPVDLDEVELPSADLRDAHLDYAQLRRANLREAQLYFADLASAGLEDAELTGANLWSVSLRNANVRRAKLNAAKLQHSDLTRAELDGADLSGAYMMVALGTEAQLNAANLSGANLIGARFAKAKLTDVDFARANLKDTILDGADLRGARNLTQQQLDVACGDPETQLPEGLTIHRGPRQCVPGMDYVPCSMRR